MGCKPSTEKTCYLNSEPTFKGSKVFKMFEVSNGLLFRIENSKKRQWAYYNDTFNYEMHIQVTFNADCDIKPLEHTELTQQENGEWVGKVVVYPCQTEMFIGGRVNGFKAKVSAVLLTDEGRRIMHQRAEERAALEAGTAEDRALPAEVNNGEEEEDLLSTDADDDRRRGASSAGNM